MKLKLVVASMSLLGLISCPVFAATQANSIHHKKIHKTVVKNNYPEMATYQIQAVPVTIETEPKVDTTQAILDAMDHNTGRAKPTPDWFNRIGVSGGANVDLKWGNRRLLYETENVNLVTLNDVYVNFSGKANDWAKAFASLSFSNPSINYSNVYRPLDTITLEQGYVTLGNFDIHPLFPAVFIQAGKQFQDFGRYNIHPLNRTLTQSLSESLQTSVNLGFISKMGFHGSVSAFDNPSLVTGSGHTDSIYGAAIGFDQPGDQFGYDVGIGYMSAMTGVNDVAAGLNSAHNRNAFNNSVPTDVVHNVGAIAVYGDVNSGPFNFGLRYTTALQSFNAANLYNSTSILLPGSGAKPWAADLTAGYDFNAWSKNQNVYLGYQASNDTVRLALPRERILAGYEVDMWKNTSVGLEYTHDYAYGGANGGPGGTTNTFGLRGAVKFG